MTIFGSKNGLFWTFWDGRFGEWCQRLPLWIFLDSTTPIGQMCTILRPRESNRGQWFQKPFSSQDAWGQKYSPFVEYDPLRGSDAADGSFWILTPWGALRARQGATRWLPVSLRQDINICIFRKETIKKKEHLSSQKNTPETDSSHAIFHSNTCKKKEEKGKQRKKQQNKTKTPQNYLFFDGGLRSLRFASVAPPILDGDAWWS